MAQIQIIETRKPESAEKLAVAAYCRVSSDSEDQLNSYRNQVDYYTDLIARNEDWELADIYADEGITGTQIEKRDEFLRMLADCRAGKINRILVKSVSRFSRNTMELIETTRELKELGVVVVFEEQGFNTGDLLGEMQLAMAGMAAQEESISIGNNLRWSIRKCMENGSFIGVQAPYGYRLKDGQLFMEPQEAAIVRQIYEMYLSGIGKAQIARILNDTSVPAHYGKWADNSIDYILKNERYLGDALLQKYYVENTLNHKQRKNKGILPQYYVENRHEPIITREVFDRVQRLEISKPKKAGISPHLFTRRIQCPDCAAFFREVTCSEKNYWSCPKQINGLANCAVHRIPEEPIKECFLNMVWKLYENVDGIFTPSIALLQEITDKLTVGNQKLVKLNTAIAEINDKLLKLNRLKEKGFIEDRDYQGQRERLSAQRSDLYGKRRQRLAGRQAPEKLEALEDLRDKIRKWGNPSIRFDIDFFDDLIEKVIPQKNDLIFQFHCGLQLKEELPQ